MKDQGQAEAVAEARVNLAAAYAALRHAEQAVAEASDRLVELLYGPQ